MQNFIMFTVLVFGLASLLWHVPSYLFDISLHFSQGPDNADVFMNPNKEDTQHISEEVLKESKIIQEEIKILLSEVCFVNVSTLEM